MAAIPDISQIRTAIPGKSWLRPESRLATTGAFIYLTDEVIE
jgi:hypothetical protein